MIRDTDSERVWDKRGLNERSVSWDPPRLLSSEGSLIEPNVLAAVQRRGVTQTYKCICL